MKGIIVDINEKKDILLSEDGEFREIKNKGYSIGQSITYNIPSYTKITALAASIILFISAGLSGAKIYFTPTDYIDVDINPSIRIGINALERVVEFTSLNDDARTILDAMGRPKGKINECLEVIVDKSENMGFINSGNCEMDIEIISDDQDFYDKTEQYCKDLAEHNGRVNINIHKSDRKNFRRAQELGISVGKLRLIDDYKAISGEDTDGSSINFPDMSNNEIKQLIESVQNTKQSAVETETGGSTSSEEIKGAGEKIKQSDRSNTGNIYERAVRPAKNAAPEKTVQWESADSDKQKIIQKEKETQIPEKPNENKAETIKEFTEK